MGWGALLEAKKKVNKMGDSVHVLEIAIRLSWDSVKDLNSVEKLRPPPANESGTTRFIPVDLDCITAVSSIRIKIPDDKDMVKVKDAIGSSIEVIFNLPYFNPTQFLESFEEV